jgi:hypothetical protein
VGVRHEEIVGESDESVHRYLFLARSGGPFVDGSVIDGGIQTRSAQKVKRKKFTISFQSIQAKGRAQGALRLIFFRISLTGVADFGLSPPA